ncbi:MAG TPA: DegT/DnrJ/EryC1/StrS family aminotransferase [Gemmatimonadales bacterium]|nr:DegT/DnrJ/EryC1/StrS family aminotransferase [Gemmatimonadales bacterium]
MRQPPAHSPLSWGALRASAGAVLRRREDARPALRQLLAGEFATDDVALFASGTQALQVALTGLAPTVALPAFTCFDVATAAVGADLRVTLYDVDPVTLTPDLDSLRGALADGAGIIVVAPLFGLPADWEAVQSLAAAAGAVLVEDAAQGAGASWQGRPLGSLGGMSVLSFGRGKGWTGGGGGALLTRRRNVPLISSKGHDRGGDLRAVSRAAVQWTFGRPALYGIPAALPWLGLGETRYRDPVQPRPLPRAAASLLLHGAAAAERETEERKRRAARLLEMVTRRPGIEPIVPLQRGVPGYLRLPLRLKGGLSGLANPQVAVRLGAARSYPRPISELPAVNARLVRRWRWPGAEELARDLITLPTHSLLTTDDLERLVRAVTG